MSEVLRLDAVSFRRNGSTILDAVDLVVRAGEHWALLGPNGAGKSTLLGFCGARTHPSAGTVDVLGRRLGRVELQALRREIGHVDPRHPVRSPLTVVEVVLTGLTGSIEPPLRWEPSADELARAHELVARVGLAPRAEAVWPVLSQGERGRALIARALIARPRLLLLDEPTTGLDVAAREQLLETIADLAAADPALATVLVTHHLEELPETTTHVLLLSRGRVVASGPAGTTLTTDEVTRTFAHPIRVSRSGARWAARTTRAAGVSGG